MKKMFRGIGKLFYHVASFFDKWLITPITKLILRITGLFKDNSKKISRNFRNKNWWRR